MFNSSQAFLQIYLFYMCDNFGWLIRVNAEAMVLLSQKT